MKLRLADLLVPVVLVLGAAGWPSDSHSQAPLPRVGIVTVGTATDKPNTGYRLELIRSALADQGWVDGRTLSLEARNARGDPSRFTEIAEELVRLKVDLIWADSAPALRAAYAATRTIPIVAGDFTTDPVAAGYAQSYARPGGNITGVFLDAPEFSGTWVELLKAMIPQLSRVAALWDPSPGDAHVRALREITRSSAIRLQVVEVNEPEDIDRVGSSLRDRPQALIILPSPMIFAESSRLARLVRRERLPATSIFRHFAEAGGVVAYGPEAVAVAERVAVLVTKILRGAKPGDLPIERPTKFDLVVNLKAAKALNLTVPDSVLARADKVIR